MKFQIIAGELCLDFINTLDNRNVPERIEELVPSYGDLLEWAMQAGALSSRQGKLLLKESENHPKQAAAIRDQAANLRECLYRMFTALARGQKVAPDDLSILNGYVSEAQSHLELQAAPDGFRLDWCEPRRLDFVLWQIVRSATQLLTGGDLEKLRECGEDTCRWLFIDRSKNHSRRWCDMKICGNRFKARRFYQKQSRT